MIALGRGQFHYSKDKKDQTKLNKISLYVGKASEEIESLKKDKSWADTMINTLHDTMGIKDDIIGLVLEREQGLRAQLDVVKVKISSLKEQLAEKPT